jgi:hypothetical protein
VTDGSQVTHESVAPPGYGRPVAMTLLSSAPGKAPAGGLAAVCPGQTAELCSPRPWLREADMLPGVLQYREQLVAGTNWRPFFEVPGPRGGIVDLVWVRFSRAALADRPRHDVPLDMTAILALQAMSGGVQTGELVRYTGVSRGHLTRRVLPRLGEAGWIQREGRSWIPSRKFRPVVTGVVTVELKRDDWRTALKQAARHRAASDASWVVLDAQRSTPAVAASASFEHAGVGLAGLALRCGSCIGEHPQLEVIHAPDRNQFVDMAGRAFFGEQCLALMFQGTRSGPERPVFGRLV